MFAGMHLANFRVQRGPEEDRSVQVDELPQRIAPDSINGVPGKGNRTPATEVSNGALAEWSATGLA